MHSNVSQSWPTSSTRQYDADRSCVVRSLALILSFVRSVSARKLYHRGHDRASAKGDGSGGGPFRRGIANSMAKNTSDSSMMIATVTLTWRRLLPVALMSAAVIGSGPSILQGPRPRWGQWPLQGRPLRGHHQYGPMDVVSPGGHLPIPYLFVRRRGGGVRWEPHIRGRCREWTSLVWLRPSS